MESGFFIIDKPRGIGSTKVVSMIKRILKPKKIGHAGTLDPLAEGVLMIAINEATKLIRFVQDGKKEYDFDIKWGSATSTDDMEGEVVASSDNRPSEEDLIKIIPEFMGKIRQVPPKYSAIKIDGERAYDLARDNIDFEMKEREVEINYLKIISHSSEATRLKVGCSKGTYVRSLARDIALKLNTFGHVSYLRRTKVGNFFEKDAILLSKVESLGHTLKDLLIPVTTLLDDIPAIAVNGGQAADLSSGKRIRIESNITNEDVLICFDGKIICISDVKDGVISPKRVILND